MAKIQGSDIISEATDKSSRRLYVLGAIIFLIKIYNVDLDDLSVLGVPLPAALFDLIAFVLIIWSMYQLIVNWLVDIIAFKNWYQSRNIWSQFQTNMEIDKSFYSGGTRLLLELHDLKQKKQFPSKEEEIPKQVHEDYQNFKINAELFVARLEAAGNSFKKVSKWGQYYVWVHAFIIPIIVATAALVVLICKGNFMIDS
ncbi:hypothetical protein [Pleomorphovibrio marinus]|uniref:hypothetical protein n=1 Tax=Pleomorphovibrio marinus TaxID=2164132 RepID=UPI000E0CB11B|nr:hypothetical protein [Pleomorphovibrio marinus]